MEPYIGIAITTKNREKAFSICHDKHLEFQPENSRIFVVDDGSADVYVEADYRYNESVGISTAKNRCLQLIHEAGCEYFFCWDDDTYPIKNGWHLPYINSLCHHLSYTFLKPNRTYGGINSFYLSNGCMLYFTRNCIDRIGGFDTRFNNKYEHVNLSQRIYNAGMTQNVHQDVINSNELIYCLDQDSAIQRSFTEREMQQNLKDGYDYFRSQEKSSRYIEFRT